MEVGDSGVPENRVHPKDDRLRANPVRGWSVHAFSAKYIKTLNTNPSNGANLRLFDCAYLCCETVDNTVEKPGTLRAKMKKGQ